MRFIEDLVPARARDGVAQELLNFRREDHLDVSHADGAELYRDCSPPDTFATRLYTPARDERLPGMSGFKRQLKSLKESTRASILGQKQPSAKGFVRSGFFPAAVGIRFEERAGIDDVILGRCRAEP